MSCISIATLTLRAILVPILMNFDSLFLCETPRYWDRLRDVGLFVRSTRISRTPFDLVSQNFTGTSPPALSTATPDMTSLAASVLKL